MNIFKYSTVFIIETNNLNDIIDLSGIISDFSSDHDCAISVHGNRLDTAQSLESVSEKEIGHDASST